jgi:hypothetical protein
MRLTKRGRGLVAGLLLAVGIGSAATIGHAVESNPEAAWNKCEVVGADQTDAGTFALLKDKKGWFASPYDGAEELYSPACKGDKVSLDGKCPTFSISALHMTDNMVNVDKEQGWSVDGDTLFPPNC